MPFSKSKKEEKKKEKKSAYPTQPTAQSYPTQAPPQAMGYPPQAQGYPPQAQGYPPQAQGYPPQAQGYPPQGPPPPYSANPQAPPPQGAAGYYPPQVQGGAYAVQPVPVNSTVVMHGGFEAGARFTGNNPASIPPPPPGVAPNAAQMAVATGQNVVMTQQKSSWISGGGEGGYSVF